MSKPALGLIKKFGRSGAYLQKAADVHELFTRLSGFVWVLNAKTELASSMPSDSLVEVLSLKNAQLMAPYLNGVFFSIHSNGLDPFAKTLFSKDESILEGVLNGLEITGIVQRPDIVREQTHTGEEV